MSNPEANKSIILNAIYTPSIVEATEMIFCKALTDN